MYIVHEHVTSQCHMLLYTSLKRTFLEYCLHVLSILILLKMNFHLFIDHLLLSFSIDSRKGYSDQSNYTVHVHLLS